MVEAWHLQSVYLGQGPQKAPQNKPGAQQQNQELTPVPANQLPPSSSEGDSAEIPPPSSQPVQLSQVPKAGTPPPKKTGQPAQSAYIGAQTGSKYQQSNYVGQSSPSPARPSASPKPGAAQAGNQQYFGKDAAGPTEYPAGGGQGPPPGADDKFVQSVYFGQGPVNGQNARPGGPASKGAAGQANASQIGAAKTQASTVKTVDESNTADAKLTPAPVGNQADKEREKALAEQKRQLQEREEAEKAEAKRLEAEKKRLEEEKERLAKEKEELEKEKERLAKLKAQKEKEAKEKELKDKEGKEKDAKEKDAKDKDKGETKEAKEDAKADAKAGAKGAGAKQKHKYSGGPSLNADRKEKLNVEVEPGKVVYAHPYDRQQIVDINLKNVSGEIVHYKVMATQPKFYRVKNKQNVILPGQSAVAAIRLEILKNPAKCKKENHRIIIQTAVSKKAQEDKKFWRDIDGKKNRVQFNRIPVKLLLEGEKDDVDGEEVEYDNNQPFIVEPESDLIFRGPYDDAVTSPICAINNTDKHMFVKVLITNPGPFRVRPNFCAIAPRSMQIFAAILEPQNPKDLEKIQKKKNKFMLEYAESEKGDQDPEHFFQKHPKNIQSIKLNATTK